MVADGGWGLPAFAALAGLPLAAYTLDSLALSQATLELGMVIKDCVILGSAGMEVAVRVAAADSGSISATDGWRHAMGATSAGLRIVTTLSLGSFGAHTSRLLPASLTFGLPPRRRVPVLIWRRSVCSSTQSARRRYYEAGQLCCSQRAASWP